MSFSGLCCQYYFTSEPLAFPLMPLCQQDTPAKPDSLQTKRCSVFTTYFRRLSSRLSAHKNLTLPFTLKTHHRACEHNLYLFHYSHIMLICLMFVWPYQNQNHSAHMYPLIHDVINLLKRVLEIYW